LLQKRQKTIRECNSQKKNVIEKEQNMLNNTGIQNFIKFVSEFLGIQNMKCRM
jgi:hypothetical protein